MKSSTMSSAFTHDSSKCIKVFVHKTLNSLIIIFQGNPVFDAILIKIDAVFISLGHAGDGGNSENSKFPLIGIVSKIYQEIPKSQSHFL